MPGPKVLGPIHVQRGEPMKRIVLVGSALLFLVAIMAVERPQAGGASGGSRFADASALAGPGGGPAVSVEPPLGSAQGKIDHLVRLVDAPPAVAHRRKLYHARGEL